MSFPPIPRLRRAAPFARLVSLPILLGMMVLHAEPAAEAAPSSAAQPPRTPTRKEMPSPVVFTPTAVATGTPSPTPSVRPAQRTAAPATPTSGTASDGDGAADVPDSSRASGLAALRATMTAVPTTDTGTVDAGVLEAILRGCDPSQGGAEAGVDATATTDSASELATEADPASCDPQQPTANDQADDEAEDVAEGVAEDVAEAEDEVAERRRRALELGAARLVPSLELAGYADRLARLNGWLVSPFGDVPLTSRMIRFGYLSDYSEELAFEIRGEEGVAQLGTKHFGLDLQIPWLPDGGRGAPVVAPFDGRIIRTADPAGGPFGIWLENRQLNLRARLMHMDGLVVGIETGVDVQAGQQLGVLGAQGTEGFPHLHIAFERLSDGARINPSLFYRLSDWSDPATQADQWYDDPAAAPAVALRQPRSAAVVPEGEGRAARLPWTLILVPDELLRPHALTDLLSPIELPYP